MNKAEVLLARAIELQNEHWDALHALEVELGFDLDLDRTGGDLSAYTVESLHREFGGAA